MTKLSLPVDVTKGDVTRTASTPTEYWNLLGAGWSVADGSSSSEEDLSPQQKAARTRAANRAREEKETSQEEVTEPVGDGAGHEGPDPV